MFFFSSRRRHTRFDCDWSSDVCSSDLSAEVVVELLHRSRAEDHRRDLLPREEPGERYLRARRLPPLGDRVDLVQQVVRTLLKIGRASCRERWQISEGAVSLKEEQTVQF